MPPPISATFEKIDCINPNYSAIPLSGRVAFLHHLGPPMAVHHFVMESRYAGFNNRPQPSSAKQAGRSARGIRWALMSALRGERARSLLRCSLPSRLCEPARARLRQPLENVLPRPRQKKGAHIGRRRSRSIIPNDMRCGRNRRDTAKATSVRLDRKSNTIHGCRS